MSAEAHPPIRFPRPLRGGDVVAVVAPSSGVKPEMHERLEGALAALRRRGFIVREGRTLRQQVRGASGSAIERASELMDVLLDPEVAAVIPPWGGELAIELLPHLDVERLREVPPKWFSGFSDLSTLQVPLLLRAGWASLHGPNLMQLGDPALDPVSRRIFDVWTTTEREPLEQLSALGSVARRLDGGTAAIDIEGCLIGGCLDSVARLVGTPWADVRAWRGTLGEGERPLWFFEVAELPPFELARTLHGLRMAGWFDGAAGVVFGRSAVPDAIASGGEFTQEQALQGALGELPCPVLLDLDIGHVGSQWSLVQGALARLEWFGGRSMLSQMLA